VVREQVVHGVVRQRAGDQGPSVPEVDSAFLAPDRLAGGVGVGRTPGRDDAAVGSVGSTHTTPREPADQQAGSGAPAEGERLPAGVIHAPVSEPTAEPRRAGGTIMLPAAHYLRVCRRKHSC
jgi:hypothetical protein